MKIDAEKFGSLKVSSHHVTEHIPDVTKESYIRFICEKRWWKTGAFFLGTRNYLYYCIRDQHFHLKSLGL
jgi:hypothetical protein